MSATSQTQSVRLSTLIAKPSKQTPKDADTTNHRLLVQAGFVRQLMAGVYTYLPLGLRTLQKISDVIRAEMNAQGAQEILMPALHPSANWKTTGAWDSVDVLFKINSRTKKEYALGQSEEEVVTPLAKEFIHSYKDLPLAMYQIGWKFRDELRAKSGILRGREFLMKDLYSFHATQADFDQYYATVKQAYLRAYSAFGLVAKATEASGGSFSQKISYEFMVLTDAGEDDILYCTACDFCVNVEVAKVKEGDQCPSCNAAKLAAGRASEVGNVFDLGQKYTKDFDVVFTDEQGKEQHPIMGCYGWGVSRTMGVLVEKFHDDKGILWPEIAAPFRVHLITIGDKDKEATALIAELGKIGVDVLWDDRDERPGVKFADADLIGIPLRVVISEKTGDKIEVKKRSEKEVQLMALPDFLQSLQ